MAPYGWDGGLLWPSPGAGSTWPSGIIVRRSPPGERSGSWQRSAGAPVAIQADLASPLEARRLVREAASALGGLDILVNSAAVFARTPFDSVTPATYDRFLDLNLRGPSSARRRRPP